jgi:electron transfer flavoprotein alpha subunit
MILIVVEHVQGAPRKSAFELVSLGRDVAEAGARSLAAVVLGAHGEHAASELARFVPNVYWASDPRLDPVRAETVTRAVAHAATTLGATVVLVPGSRAAASYGPRLALRLGGALLEDVTSLRLENGVLTATRPTFLARLSATVVADVEPVVVSVKSGAAPVAAPAEVAGDVHALEVPLEAQDERLEPGAQQAVARGRVALEEADVIVCGGRGFGSSEAFERHVVGLADRLGAGVGATRAVVDAGWRPYGEQIGQTGKTVAPRLYLALAVSGAVQHLSGMNRSGVIVAVNKDADAPIFKVADYGIVGDVLDVTPALEEALAAND